MQELTMNEMMELNGGQGHGDKKRTIKNTTSGWGQFSTAKGYLKITSTVIGIASGPVGKGTSMAMKVVAGAMGLSAWAK